MENLESVQDFDFAFCKMSGGPETHFEVIHDDPIEGFPMGWAPQPW